MTIEEATKEIEDWKLLDSDSKKHYSNRHKQIKMFIQGYKAKEKELQNSLVIPDGWRLDEVNTVQNEYCAVHLRNSKLKINVIGDGVYPHEALKDAIKQINE